MEKMITKVEKELKVKVQRFDVLRDRFARNLYEKIDEIEFVGDVPLLYHRESRQSIYGLEDDLGRLKSWAKGRWLPPKQQRSDGVSGAGSEGFLPDGEEILEEEYMLEDELTELQQKGREKIIERMQKDS